jgi:predicted nucleic acid-binding protein
MKKLKLYLDASVISHLDASDAPEKMADTRRLWAIIKHGRYDIVISDATVDELEGCAEPKRSFMYEQLAEIEYSSIGRAEETKALANLYVEIGGLPPKSRVDALHLAIASVAGCQAILSWNFRHIVNLRAITAVETVNIREGYYPLKILSPTMLLESED